MCRESKFSIEKPQAGKNTPRLMKSYNIGVIPGDGTGPEVVREALKVLKTVAASEKLKYTLTEFDYGGDRYLKSGKVIDEAEIQGLRKFDAVLLGALGHPDVKPGILEKGILLRLRFDLDQYINLRPVHLYPGVDTPLKDKGPEHINFDVIRENTEDLYAGIEHEVTPGTVVSLKTSTVAAGARLSRWAFEYMRYRGRRTIHCCHKAGVNPLADGAFLDAFRSAGVEYPFIQQLDIGVDSLSLMLPMNPSVFDVLLLQNLYGDILSDLCAGLAGGLGEHGQVGPGGGAPARTLCALRRHLRLQRGRTGARPQQHDAGGGQAASPGRLHRHQPLGPDAGIPARAFRVGEGWQGHLGGDGVRGAGQGA